MLKATFECMADGVVVVDNEGRFLFFNEAARTILGLGALDAAPEEWSSRYGCFRSDKVTPYPSEELPLARAMRGERAEDEFFVRNSNIPEGVSIHVRGTPLVNEAGARIGAAVVFQDVTQRRRAEQTVRRLAQAVERATDAVVITDAQARIEYVNPAFEATTGYTRDRGGGTSNDVPGDWRVGGSGIRGARAPTGGPRMEAITPHSTAGGPASCSRPSTPPLRCGTSGAT